MSPHRPLLLLMVAAMLVACGPGDPTPDAGGPDAGTEDGGGDDAGVDDGGTDDGGVDDGGSGDGGFDGGTSDGGFARIRVVAANTTSGNNQQYEGPGTRIFQALDADVVAIQEFTPDMSAADGDAFYWATVDAWVLDAFGAGYSYFRESEPTDTIPNGIVSRHPILDAGEWTQTWIGGGENRDYAWARIDIPGPKDLWVVSVHLYSSSATARATEASEVVTNVQANIPAGDYLVVAGDLNTGSRGEACVATLAAIVDTAAPYPADQLGNTNTSGPRSNPYDWVLADADLRAHEVPVRIGASTFASGLVLDSRVYTPLAEISPVLLEDSGATNMQHMAVIRDFLVPLP